MDDSVDVAIVGAGPTGLSAALALALRGVRIAVLERAPEGANTSRAAVVHARTLEALEATGVTGRLVARGLPVSRFTVRDRDRVLVPLRFDTLPTRYPYLLMVSQAITEAVLRDRLSEAGGHVAWQRAVSDVVQDAEGVTVTLADQSRLRARYLVGADGMHSTVRERAGIGFQGGRYEQSFSLADVHLDGAARDEGVLYFSPAGLVVLVPLPDGDHRIVATVESAPEHPDVAYVQALLDARGPEREPIRAREVLWGSRFRVHHRVADSYRKGRILLAGDAAHVHSPAGGQGMNTGIQDALVLADSLVAALADGGSASLDAYEARRRPIALDVVQLTDRLTRLATVGRRWRPARNALIQLVARAPRFQRRLAWTLSGLEYRTA